MKKRESLVHVPRKVKGQPRVLFYSHDGLGLGHLRITLAVAAGLAHHVLERLTAIAETLSNVTFVRFRTDLESHVAAADVVVTMGGYNSVWEAIGAGKRPIVAPRQMSSDEQMLRAERVSALGLATTLLAADLTPATLAQAVRAELERGVSPTATVAVDLDFAGSDRVGAELARLLGR